MEGRGLWGIDPRTGTEPKLKLSIKEVVTNVDAALVKPQDVRAQSDDPEAGIVEEAKAGAVRSEPRPFTDGKMVYFSDRVELCGVDICSGPRSQKTRVILDILRKKLPDGSFASYSGKRLAVEAGLKGEDGAAGAIRDLRRRISNILRSAANIDCGLEDVVLSGGPGYRFAESVTVQEGDQPIATPAPDVENQSDVRNVPNENVRNDDVRNVLNVRNEDVRNDAAETTRRGWILRQLREDHQLRAPAVAKHFKCSLKTAQRELQTLRDEGLIEFVGATRTGYYRLRTTTESTG